MIKLIILALASVVCSSAQSVYVATSGSDSSSGSQSSPFKSITKAISSVSAGGIIHVGSGSYGALSITKSGTASQPITIQSSGASLASLDISADYVTVDGFDTTGNVNINGGSSYVTLSNNKIHDISGVGIFLNGCSSTVSNVTLLKNEISHGAHDGIDLWCNTDTIIIDGNYVHDLQPDASADHVDMIQAYGSAGTSNKNVVIRNNRASNIQEGILFKDFPTTNITIENNTLFTGGPWDIYLFSTTGAVVRHNTAAAINFDATTKNITLQNNIANQIAVLNGSTTFTTRGYNLIGGWVGLSSSTGDITGAPTYVGGNNPTSWSGYKLASNSKGYRAGSDGLDIGTSYFGDGSTTAAPPTTVQPPTNLKVVVQ